MHVSLLHLNRLFEEDSFKTELRIRLVDSEDLVQVEFRNTLKQTDGTHLLCKLHLTPPSSNMPRAVSLTYHFKLEHFICSNQPRPQGFSLKKWVGRPTHFLREKPWGRGCCSNLLLVDKFWVRYLTEFSQCLANPSVQRSD